MGRKKRSENKSNKCALGVDNFWIFETPAGHVRIEVHKNNTLLVLADYDRISLLNCLSEYILFDRCEDALMQVGESPEFRDTIGYKKGDTYEFLCGKTEMWFPYLARPLPYLDELESRPLSKKEDDELFELMKHEDKANEIWLKEEEKLDKEEWQSVKTAAIQAEGYFRSHVAERLFQAMKQLLLEAALSARDGEVSVDKARKLARFTEPPKPCFPVRGRGGRKAAVDLSDLPKHYEVTYKSVKRAKRIRKDNEDLDWKAIVKNELPNMDQDLIDRIDEQSELPESLKTALSDKGGTSACSDIALEWAARLCCATPYQYTLGYLRTRKTNRSQKQ
ncbi:MAG: hypothetical protein L0229_00180 [Blastocatellia bacterium]|nr:hypothetical protein [Blastocatellia bacterium]